MTNVLALLNPWITAITSRYLEQRNKLHFIQAILRIFFFYRNCFHPLSSFHLHIALNQLKHLLTLIAQRKLHPSRCDLNKHASLALLVSVPDAHAKTCFNMTVWYTDYCFTCAVCLSRPHLSCCNSHIALEWML